MEPLKQTVTVPLEEETQVAGARRAVRTLGDQVGVAEEAIARAELVTVELAGNILRHAGRGRLLITVQPELKPAGRRSACGLQIVGMDQGPGISSVESAMSDGWTTSTTPGFGLGAMKRLAESFDLYTEVGKGTVISVTVGGPASGSTVRPGSVRRPAGAARALGVISTSMEGETLNGDSWALFRAGGRSIYLMVDGLGHGLYASEAAAMAIGIAERGFAEDPELGLEALVIRMNEPMRATRGAAVTILAHTGADLVCCGVGNISGTLQSPDGRARGLVSANGTVGHQVRSMREVRLPCPAGSLLVMHTDGLSTRWRLSEYAGLERQSAATIAGVLYRDNARGRDDATVLVAHLDEVAEASRVAVGARGDHA